MKIIRVTARKEPLDQKLKTNKYLKETKLLSALILMRHAKKII